MPPGLSFAPICGILRPTLSRHDLDKQRICLRSFLCLEAREEINGLADELNKVGREFNISKDTG